MLDLIVESDIIILLLYIIMLLFIDCLSSSHRRAALETWKQKNGSNATYNNLIVAFKNAECHGYADIVKRLRTTTEKDEDTAKSQIEKLKVDDSENQSCKLKVAKKVTVVHDTQNRPQKPCIRHRQQASGITVSHIIIMAMFTIIIMFTIMVTDIVIQPQTEEIPTQHDELYSLKQFYKHQPVIEFKVFENMPFLNVTITNSSGKYSNSWEIVFQNISSQYQEITVSSDMNIKGLRLILTGPAGVGKSTLLRHLAKEWAEGRALQSCDILFLIALDSLKGTPTSLTELLQQPQFAELRDDGDYGRNVYKRIHRNNGNGTCFLLDSYDRYTSRHDANDIVDKIFFKNQLSLSLCVLMSRRSDHTQQMKIEGLNNNYLEDSVIMLSNNDSNVVKAISNLWKSDHNIRKICENPLHLVLLVSIAKDHDNESNLLVKTRTQIYTSFMNMTISKRHFPELAEYEFGSEHDAFKWCLTTGKHDNPCIALRHLSHSAYMILFENKTKFNVINENVQDCIKKLSFVRVKSNATGIVMYNFSHQTFLEFCAAIHLVLNFTKEEILNDYVKSHTGNEMTWIFFFGLLGEHYISDIYPSTVLRYFNIFTSSVNADNIVALSGDSIQTHEAACCQDIFEYVYEIGWTGEKLLRLLQSAGLLENHILCNENIPINNNIFKFIGMFNVAKVSDTYPLNTLIIEQDMRYFIEDSDADEFIDEYLILLVDFINTKVFTSSNQSETFFNIMHSIFNAAMDNDSDSESDSEIIHESPVASPHGHMIVQVNFVDNNTRSDIKLRWNLWYNHIIVLKILDQSLPNYTSTIIILRHVTLKELSCEELQITLNIFGTFTAFRIYTLSLDIDSYCLEHVMKELDTLKVSELELTIKSNTLPNTTASYTRSCVAKLSALKRPGSLVKLEIAVLNMPLQCMVSFRNCSKLKFLSITSFNITDVDHIKELRTLKQLETLELMHVRDAELSGSMLKTLSKSLPVHLQNLHLDDNAINDHGIQLLAKSLRDTPKLAFLSLSYNPITESGLKSLVDALKLHKNFASLDLSGIPLSATVCLEEIGKLTNLRNLRISNCSIGDAEIKVLVDALVSNPNIYSLNLSHNPFLRSEDGLQQLARLSNISHLDISGWSSNSDAFGEESHINTHENISAVLKNLTQLRALNLCTITDSPIYWDEKLASAISNLTKLHSFHAPCLRVPDSQQNVLD